MCLLLLQRRWLGYSWRKSSVTGYQAGTESVIWKYRSQRTNMNMLRRNLLLFSSQVEFCRSASLPQRQEHERSNTPSGNRLLKFISWICSAIFRIMYLDLFKLQTLLFLVERNFTVNHGSRSPRKYVLWLSPVRPITCNVGSLALNQFKKLQKLNTYIIIMMTEKAMNVLQLHLLSLLRKKKLIICSCQPWRPRPI